MPLITNFGDFVEIVLVLPKLAKLNRDNRKILRDAVGTVADELQRGLGLVKLRIEGAKVIARSADRSARKNLQQYMLETEAKLFEAFSAFKICQGLRDVRDRVKSPFDSLAGAIAIQHIGRVKAVMLELESDERMIIDEAGPLLNSLSVAAKGPLDQFGTEADKVIRQLERRASKIKTLAKQFDEKL